MIKSYPRFPHLIIVTLINKDKGDEFMKFSIDRKYFYNKLSVTSRAISVFSPLPALSGIHIRVEANKIILTGSDSNISIRTMIESDEQNQLKIESEGSIVMDSKYLLEIVRKIDSPVIEMELMDFELVRITSNNGQFNLNGIEAEQYPNIDFSQPETAIHISTSDLKDIVNQTAYACGDNDQQRPVLMGINFNIQQNQLYCSGTDSYRLARKKVTIDSKADMNVTIPNKSLSEVVKSLSDEQQQIDMYIDRKKAQFIFDQTIFQTRLLDGSFPEVERIIPTSSVATLVVSSHELTSIVDRTNFIRNDKIHLVKLECSEDIVRVKTSSSEIGNSDEVMTDCIYQGEPLTLTCNGSFLLDAVRALHCEKVELKFSGLMKPIRIINPEDDSAIMIIVPVRSYD